MPGRLASCPCNLRHKAGASLSGRGSNASAAGRITPGDSGGCSALLCTRVILLQGFPGTPMRPPRGDISWDNACKRSRAKAPTFLAALRPVRAPRPRRPEHLRERVTLVPLGSVHRFHHPLWVAISGDIFQMRPQYVVSHINPHYHAGSHLE